MCDLLKNIQNYGSDFFKYFFPPMGKLDEKEFIFLNFLCGGKKVPLFLSGRKLRLLGSGFASFFSCAYNMCDLLKSIPRDIVSVLAPSSRPCLGWLAR